MTKILSKIVLSD